MHMRGGEAKATLWASRSHVRLGSIRCVQGQRSKMSRRSPRPDDSRQGETLEGLSAFHRSLSMWPTAAGGPGTRVPSYAA
ncbi:hypothetical protein CCMA1212_008101 [Trichoderma ghanense]|uniref:Uncharacterized protein n=1 Tax=Trichoderma ghanense TaxID=65468 RepID=A0ABY2GX84_9HYPO